MSIKSEGKSNQLIAKNSVFLVTRSILGLVIGLYTSRVLLAKLGIDDYGVYHVVGSFGKNPCLRKVDRIFSWFSRGSLANPSSTNSGSLFCGRNASGTPSMSLSCQAKRSLGRNWFQGNLSEGVKVNWAGLMPSRDSMKRVPSLRHEVKTPCLATPRVAGCASISNTSCTLGCQQFPLDLCVLVIGNGSDLENQVSSNAGSDKSSCIVDFVQVRVTHIAPSFPICSLI